MSFGSEAARVAGEALAIVRERRGLDFSGYRRPTIERRLLNRMAAARVSGGDAYLALLRESDSEVDHLCAKLTINVSRFYRNAAMFDALRERVVPELRASFAPEPLRAWSAGCGSGEEPYTLAMLLDAPRETIDATDINESALATARSGKYANKSFAETPEDLLRTFFLEEGGEKVPLLDVRRRVRFLRHDVARADGPPVPSPYHLVCCRNVLIYFDRPLQQQVMRLLVRSLTPGGVLCLGEAEWPIDESSSLEVLDRRNRIFRRLQGVP